MTTLHPNTARRVLLLLILAGLVILPAMAQSTLEDKFTGEFDKIKNTSNYVYLNDKEEIQYSILNYDPDYIYYIRVYSDWHRSILQEYPIKEQTGIIPFKYPGLNFKIYINLQKWIPEGKEREYCKSYPCKIGENLDIFPTSINEKVPASDFYMVMIRYWTRSSFDKIWGASWQARINADVGSLR